MDRMQPMMSDYRAILERFATTDDELVREQALLDATELAKTGLGEGPAIEQMVELHRQIQAELSDNWARPEAGEVGRAARDRLARGETTPLMLALMLPHEVEQRAHHERRWRREHETLAAMFEQTDDLIVILDADGLIDDVNPAFCRATGWSALEAVVGIGVWNKDLPLHTTQQVQAEMKRRDGSTFSAAWSISQVLGRSGNVLSHVCIGRDITRARQIEEQLRETDKLHAVATLAGGIAHDFNNLLGSILGLAELCALEAAEGSRQARNLGRIEQAGRKAAALVRQMLDFSRQTPQQMERIQLGSFLDQAEGLLRAAVPRHLLLDIDVLEDGAARIDVVQMDQVLLNITRNAAHAMRDRGQRIWIRLDHARPGTSHDAADAPLGYLRLRISDEGEGMPPEVRQKIFEPFFTTKPVGEGTGLGLAAVHGIVESHGGAIEVDSEPGVGTTFSLYLPVAGDDAPGRSAQVSAPSVE